MMYGTVSGVGDGTTGAAWRSRRRESIVGGDERGETRNEKRETRTVGCGLMADG